MGDNKETVSIIIPNFNNAQTLGRAIESCLNQNQHADEIIVIDDGSTDNSSDVIKKFSDSITCDFQTNSGVSAARNRGIQIAKSKWIMFLDADDEFMPNRISAHAKHFSRNAGAIISDQLNIDAATQASITASSKSEINEKYRDSELKKGVELKEKDIETLLTQGPIEIRSLSVKREVLMNLSGFPKGVRIGEDFILFAKILNTTPTIYTNDVVAKYNIHTNSALRANKIKSQREFIQTLNTAASLIPETKRFIKAGINNRARNEKINLAYQLIKNQERKQALTCALSTLFKHKDIKSAIALISVIRG